MSNYASLVSLSARVPKQAIGYSTNMDSDLHFHPLKQLKPSPPFVKLRAHSAPVSTYQSDKKENSEYSSTLGSSNDQLYQGHPIRPYMIWVPRRFYGKLTYDVQKQAYVFTENGVLVPLEKGNLVIFPEPTKHCFRYYQQTM